MQFISVLGDTSKALVYKIFSESSRNETMNITHVWLMLHVLHYVPNIILVYQVQIDIISRQLDLKYVNKNLFLFAIG